MRCDIDEAKGYVLHTRAFKETSLLMDVFTEQHGRVSLIAKGAKRAKSKFRGILQPFTQLKLSWVGKKNTLYTLRDAEQCQFISPLQGHYLISGFYLNELLIRLLVQDDPYESLYFAYHQTIQAMSAKENLQPLLRAFEQMLLTEIGYGLKLSQEANTEKPIHPENWYLFDSESGFTLAQAKGMTLEKANCYKGAHLLAIANNQLDSLEVLRTSKRLMRTALSRYLGSKPLNSRKML